MDLEWRGGFVVAAADDLAVWEVVEVEIGEQWG